VKSGFEDWNFVKTKRLIAPRPGARRCAAPNCRPAAILDHFTGKHCPESTKNYQNGRIKYQFGSSKWQISIIKYQFGSSKWQNGSSMWQISIIKYQFGSSKWQNGNSKWQNGSSKWQNGSSKWQNGSLKWQT
jgi:hypothetical protein